MGLCGVRWSARRERNRRDGKEEVSIVLFYAVRILALRKTHDAATDGAADLRIGIAEVAVLIVCRRLITRLRLLCGQYMRNAMRQPAELREQHGEYQQQFQKYGLHTHGCDLNKEARARQGRSPPLLLVAFYVKCCRRLADHSRTLTSPSRWEAVGCPAALLPPLRTRKREPCCAAILVRACEARMPPTFGALLGSAIRFPVCRSG